MKLKTTQSETLPHRTQLRLKIWISYVIRLTIQIQIYGVRSFRFRYGSPVLFTYGNTYTKPDIPLQNEHVFNQMVHQYVSFEEIGSFLFSIELDLSAYEFFKSHQPTVNIDKIFLFFIKFYFPWRHFRSKILAKPILQSKIHRLQILVSFFSLFRDI